MIEFEINGQKIKANDGETIIQAADRHNIYIPRFCYHCKLSVAANCRMCLVEADNSKKPVPACATPVAANLKVFTQSPKALEAQRIVMEFLLINHPLDCPICDQGGECELQDLSMGYGSAYTNYDEAKRAVTSDDIGPLIETSMTRCIQCTRCVRFGEEIAGLRELGATGRGEDMQIGTYVKHFLQSELSGNIIDLCPVGALTSKPYRYSARAWELVEHRYVAPHDCVGSNIFHHSRGQEFSPQRVVMRTVPRENEAINETWISDRDRFSYEALQSGERVTKPLMKKGDRWIEVDWERALLEIVDRTRSVIQTQGADQIGALLSPSSTVEECYLFQKLIRALGSNNIDHRIREQDFKDQDVLPAYPSLNISIADIEERDFILLVGSNIRFEAPLLAHRINKAVKRGASVVVINPVDFRFTFSVAQKFITLDLVQILSQLAKTLADSTHKTVEALKDVVVSEEVQQLAHLLKTKSEPFIMLGAMAQQHPQASVIRRLCWLIGFFTGAVVGTVSEGANSAGAWLAGAVPHRLAANQPSEKLGKNAREMFIDSPLQAYFLLNIEPELDIAYSKAALEALSRAKLVVCMNTFATDAMKSYADFILPVAPYTETSGTFVNAAGDWQNFSAVSVPLEEAKPAWKTVRVLANLFGLEDFDYQTAHQVRHELESQLSKLSTLSSPNLDLDLENFTLNSSGLFRLGAWPMYRTDGFVRRSSALQATQSTQEFMLAVNQHTADRLRLSTTRPVMVEQNGQMLSFSLLINNTLANDAVWLASGIAETAGFGEAMAPIALYGEKV